MNKDASSSPNQVMIIDDDHLVRNYAEHTIAYGVNRQVITFNNGFHAWKYIQQHPQKVDVVIADANIPDMDGFELLNEFKRLYPNKIFIITTSNPKHEKMADRLGADAFLLKPFDINDLFVVIKKYIIDGCGGVDSDDGAPPCSKKSEPDQASF